MAIGSKMGHKGPKVSDLAEPHLKTCHIFGENFIFPVNTHFLSVFIEKNTASYLRKYCKAISKHFHLNYIKTIYNSCILIVSP